MSSSSSTFIIGIGPSGSLQAAIPLTSPGATLATIAASATSTTSTMSSTGATTPATSSSSPTQSASSGSAASRTPNLGAIIGGTLGGITVLLWLLALLWWANRHSWFRRPGYERQKDNEKAFGKRSPITPTTESAAPFSHPPMSMVGARTFGQPQPQRPPPPSTRLSFGDPPRPSYGDPPRTNFERTSFGDLPRPGFGAAPPVPSLPPPRPNPPPPPRSSTGFGINDRPRSGFGDRSISIAGFGDRPRSGFGDRPRSGFGDHRRSMSPENVRRFFGVNSNKQDEWAGAGRRISIEPGSPEVEDRGGILGFFARAKESAERKKRVKAEYEEDMRRMRGRSAVESDYGRY
ncbi:hypothetical protein B0J17DRAFT_720214 [Rhizoctonia solani]|nr:hypothetical protein B0J17DRAFT_720214 [Rhizoctonia solani]